MTFAKPRAISIKTIIDIKKTALLLIFIFLLSVSSARGESPDQTHPIHSLEISILIGELSIDQDQFNEEDTKQVKFSYDHELNNRMYFGGGYLNGESGGLSPVDDVFGGNELDYDAVFIKSGYRYLSSPKHVLYGEVLALNSNTTLLINDVIRVSTNELGWGYATGWQYSLSNRTNLKLGLERLMLNSQLTLKSFSLGIAYRF